MRKLVTISLMLVAVGCSDADDGDEGAMVVTTAPYGTWASPISALQVFANSNSIGTVRAGGDGILWLERRAEEGGRTALMTMGREGEGADGEGAQARVLTPEGFNVRSRVHEYGITPYTWHDGTVYFSNFADQRIYRQVGDGAPEPITPGSSSDLRYGDCLVDSDRNRLICVREDHRAIQGEEGEAVNLIVAIDLETGGEGEVLFSGTDFVRNPVLSPGGGRLAWVAWMHPNMPWDDTALYEASIANNGRLEGVRALTNAKAGSVKNPAYAPDGTLYFLADWSNWYNLYRASSDGNVPVTGLIAEMDSFAFEDDDSVVAAIRKDGFSRLVRVDLESGESLGISLPLANIGGLIRAGDDIWLTAGTMTEVIGIQRMKSGLTTGLTADSNILRVYTPAHAELDGRYVSMPTAITFPTGAESEQATEKAYGFFYAPRNPDFRAPETEKPPLIVFVHGGPIGATRAGISARIQYWTSRGFAILDVNYRGSSGFGRAFRERLYGGWGVLDVEDVVAGARWLGEQGLVDGERLAIRGGSAGGFTVLAALAFHDGFDAGTSYFGISDLEVLAKETHKFESRYLDQLIGPYPEARDVYLERSPLYSVDNISVPLMLFQGLEDRVVPPNQSQMIFDAVRVNGVPVGYVPIEGEGHGFRKPENNIRTLELELGFYGLSFGFKPAGNIPAPALENWPPTQNKPQS